MLRSIPIKIKVNEIIVNTIALYKKGLQHCVDVAWGMKIRNNVQLHPFVYQDLRKMGLPSQLSVACIKQSCGMVKKAKSNPIINKVSIRYNAPRSFSFKNNILSISTIQGRVKIPIKIPDYASDYFDWEIRESLLTQNKGKYYFTFTFLKEDVQISQHNNRILGIDLGVNKIAVTSDGKFYGKNIKQLRVKHDRFVSILQSKCTKASRRKLKKISGSWRRFMQWSNHNISKDIVGSLNNGDVIVMEDLKGIRKSARYNKSVHKWAFFEFQKFIEYKALAKGIRVVYINPAYTSKTCSVCHNRDTIRHRGFVECKTCGHKSDSDFGASKNIAQLYKRNMCRAIVTKPIVSCDDAILRG